MRKKACNKALIEHKTEIIKKQGSFQQLLEDDHQSCLQSEGAKPGQWNILKRVKEQHKARVEKQLASKRREKKENDKLHEKVEQVHSKSNNLQQWNVNELKTLVSWFK